jgi:hypothetical protein
MGSPQNLDPAIFSQSIKRLQYLNTLQQSNRITKHPTNANQKRKEGEDCLTRKKKVAMASCRIFMIIAIVAVFVPSILATEHMVGDKTGWTLGFNYQTWAQGKAFYVGDTLGSSTLFKQTAFIFYYHCIQLFFLTI